MGMTLFHTGQVSPVVRAQVSQIIMPYLHATEDSLGIEASRIESGYEVWRHMSSNLRRHLRSRDIPSYWGITATDWCEKVIDALSEVIFTVETPEWRRNRSEIVDWASERWEALDLPGKLPETFQWRSNWKRASYYMLSPDGVGLAYLRPTSGRTTFPFSRHIMAIPRKDWP